MSATDKPTTTINCASIIPGTSNTILKRLFSMNLPGSVLKKIRSIAPSAIGETTIGKYKIASIKFLNGKLYLAKIYDIGSETIKANIEEIVAVIKVSLIAKKTSCLFIPLIDVVL